MLKYNDDNIFVGYIKQLLSSFNYLDMDILNDNIIPIENQLYLKDNSIVRYSSSGEKLIKEYRDNEFILNMTKSFKNNSFIYDEHTHIWLGRYLRYLKNYKKLNLMSMYNCFSNTLVTRDIAGIDVEDSNYKTYSIPISFFNEYSIYVECTSDIKIGCYLDKNLDDSSLTVYSAKLYHTSEFRKPIIFDALTKENLENASQEDLKRWYTDKTFLRMYIQIPATCNSTIVVLEGNYTGYNDFIFSVDVIYDNLPSDTNFCGEDNFVSSSLPKLSNIRLKYNKAINNYEYIDDGELNDKFISPLELTYINSKVSHPFASRLMEYLLNNSITHLDNVPDNIKRVQKELKERYFNVRDNNHMQLGMAGYGNNYGIWIPRMRNTLYDIEVNSREAWLLKDMLGYVDKDVERELGKDIDIYSKDGGYDL